MVYRHRSYPASGLNLGLTPNRVLSKAKQGSVLERSLFVDVGLVVVLLPHSSLDLSYWLQLLVVLNLASWCISACRRGGIYTYIYIVSRLSCLWCVRCYAGPKTCIYV